MGHGGRAHKSSEPVGSQAQVHAIDTDIDPRDKQLDDPRLLCREEFVPPCGGDRSVADMSTSRVRRIDADGDAVTIQSP